LRGGNDRHFDELTRASLAGSIGDQGVSPISRRDLLKAGAAGLLGLGLPLVAPSGAQAGDCDGKVLTANIVPGNLPPGFTVSAPTFSNGQLCVTGNNGTGMTLVGVWNIWSAPNANQFGNGTQNYLIGQTLINDAIVVIPPGPFGPGSITGPVCANVPNLGSGKCPCPIQADFGIQRDLTFLEVPVRVLEGNIVSFILIGGDVCPPTTCCRMTGGGKIGTIFTLNGVQVSTSEGFQLRSGPGAHSNLEVNFGGTTPGSGVNNFHLGPPDGFSDFVCARTSCPGGGGGGQPQNDPNTILGFATGTLNGLPATVFINFVDCGEPGVDDTREIKIWYGITNPISDIEMMLNNVPVVIAMGNIDHGNNQIHGCKD